MTALVCLGLAGVPAAAQPSDGDLAPFWADWLTEVEVIVDPAETEAFLGLSDDAERLAFIRAFWKARDPFAGTARNEIRDLWDFRVRQTFFFFNDLSTDLAKVALLLGTFGVEDVACRDTRLRLLRWDIRRSAWAVPFLVRDEGGLVPASQRQLLDLFTSGECAAPAAMQGAVLGVPPVALARSESRLRPPSTDWLGPFLAGRERRGEEVEIDRSGVSIGFPETYADASMVEIAIRVPESLQPSDAAGRVLESVLLRGVALGSAGTVRIRHRFYLPLEERGEPLRLAARRVLPTGSYRMLLEVEREGGPILVRGLYRLEVPAGGQRAVAQAALPAGTTNNVTQIAARPRLRLQPLEGMATGREEVRVEAVGAGIRRVGYLLEGREVASSESPPYTALVDFGSRPRTWRLEAVAFDAAGHEMARAATVVNPETVPLRLEIRDPYTDGRGRMVIAPDLTIPEGAVLRRLELFAEEELVATLTSAPFEFRLDLEGRDRPTYLRGVATLRDGRTSQYVHAIGMPGSFEQMDVDLVELFATVSDRHGRPVPDLAPAELWVLEDGVVQSVREVQAVADVPLVLGLVMDTSASMERDLSASRTAAGRFLDAVLTDRDRATLLGFNHETQLVVPMTGSRAELQVGLDSLAAWGGTTLHDSVMLALYTFHGLEGRRALVVLTDGRDEHSRFDVDELLDSAVRSGTIVHAIALGDGADGGTLQRLAEATGGTFSRVALSTQLGDIYAGIERALRSQYRISYQSSLRTPGFRSVAVKTTRPGLEVRALRGYYP